MNGTLLTSSATVIFNGLACSSNDNAGTFLVSSIDRLYVFVCLVFDDLFLYYFLL